MTDLLETPPPTAAPARDRLLDAAARIGRRLAASALWDGAACTWTVLRPDQTGMGLPPRHMPADGFLYPGTAGIALFLAELYGATGDESLRPVVLGGLRHALDRAEADRAAPNFAFFTGPVGIAWAADRAGTLLGRDDLSAAVPALLHPLLGREGEDREADVIGGAAGAVAPLLDLARRRGDPRLTELAVRMGDHLLRTAWKEPVGWSWAKQAVGSSVRNLAGMAHGASGPGYALLELYHATGRSEYRYAAEQAFLYERQFFDPRAGNWPDLRHEEISEYLFENRLPELEALLRSGGQVPAYTPRFTTAWCHGAPGIALVRLRAWELLGDPRYEAEARAAVDTTLHSLDNERSNYSLCHGHAGNSETLLHAAGTLGDAALLGPARARMLMGIARDVSADGAWPCGTQGQGSDPGLMVGEAGIGHFLLRVAGVPVPPILLVTVGGPPAPDDGGAGAAALRARYVAGWFGRTTAVMEALTGTGLPPADAQTGAETGAEAGAFGRPDVADAFRALQARIAAEPDWARRGMLLDAFAPDRARYEAAVALTDFTGELLDRVTVRRPEDVIHQPLVLSPACRVVETEWDWDAWLAQGAEGEPPRTGAAFAVVRLENRLHARRLSPFALAVLQQLGAPATRVEVARGLEEQVPPELHPHLEGRVTTQLMDALRAGIVRPAP